MKIGIVFACLVTASWFAGCDSEPFVMGDLRLTSIKNTKTSAQNAYQYRKGKLYTFKLGIEAAGAVRASSKFYYKDDLLDRIVSDSTAATAYVVTYVYYLDGQIKEDSTFSIGDKTRILLSKRDFTFDTNKDLVRVMTRTWTAGSVADEEVELVRTARNVTKLSRYRLVGANRELARQLTVQYDGQRSAYPTDISFFYTLASDELFWLSSNNPLVIQEDGKKDLTYTYSYNRFNYPSLYKPGGTTEFGVTYVQN